MADNQLIRPLVPSRIPAVYEFVQRDRDSLEALGWLAWAPGPIFYDHYVHCLTLPHIKIWTVHDRDQTVGLVEAEQETDQWRVGYCLSVAARGRGIATRAVKQAVAQLFEITGRVVADVDRGNHPSNRVLSRCNFVQVGTTDTSDHWQRDRD